HDYRLHVCDHIACWICCGNPSETRRAKRQRICDHPSLSIRREYLIEVLLILLDHIQRCVVRFRGDHGVVEAEHAAPEWPERETGRLERIWNEPSDEFLAGAEIASRVAHLIEDQSVRVGIHEGDFLFELLQPCR